MATVKKRIALFLFTMALTAALIVMLAFCGLNVFSSEKAIQLFETTAEAATLTTSGKWQSNGQTVNFTPEIVAGDTWDTLIAKGWGKDSGTPALEVYETEYGYGIRPQNTGLSADIGNDDFTGGIYYTIKLSEADLVKAAAGQLSISASAQYYRQATASVDLSLRAEFHRLDGSDISTAIVTSEDGGGSPKKLTLTATSVPVETAYIEMWFSNSKSLSARPWIADMQAYLHDATAPSAVSSALIENSAVTARGGVIAGDTVEYSVTFNEKISVDNPGTAKISVAGTEVGFSSYSLTETAGISTVKYSFGIPKAANNGTISFSGVSGSVVKDEAGNTATVAYTGSPGTLNYYAEADITVNCSDMTYTGDATASLGTDASIVFMPDEGYSLPSAVTVTIGGIQIPNSYKYYADTGRVTVYGAYIKSDIAVAADGVANTYTVTYDSNKPAGASGTVIGATADSTHTYDTEKALTANGYTLTGWTFKGWSKTASGGKEFDNSQSVENLTATDGGTVTLYAVWEANTYTVTYNSNKPIGASGTVIGATADSAHTYDTAKVLTANGYTLTGWTFKGWSKTASGGKEFDNSQSVENLTATDGGTATLYAVWEANTYTVTYNSNKPIGASGTIDGTTADSTHTYDTEKALTANGYTLTGWTFKGWSKTASGGKEFDNSQSVENLTATDGGTVTLYAVWEANTYTVTYNSNKPIGASDTIAGTTADSVHTYDVEKALTANGFSLTGWTFKGWSQTASGVKEYDNSQSVENLTATDGGTVTLYAVWEANTYTVTYNSNKPIGASDTIAGTTADSVHTYDVEKALTANEFSLTGWTFKGWSKTASGGKAYDNSQIVENLTATDGGTVTLYAVWEANTYTVTYNSNKPIGASDTIAGTTADSVHTYDVEKALTTNGFSLTGWTFKGWSKTASGGKAYDNSQIVENLTATDGGTVTLYAVWEANTYTVTYNSNKPIGASGTIAGTTADSAHTYDAEKALTANGFSLTGWTFKGWSQTASGVKEYDNSQSVENLTATNGGTVTLYAVWEANTYTVTYNSNKPIGASDTIAGTTAESSHTYDTEKALTANGYTLTGWTFKGWSKTASGGKEFDNSQSVENLTATNGGTVTLYAVWEANTYTVTYNSNKPIGASGTIDGTTAGSAHTYDTEKQLTANGYTLTGWTFLGWARTDSGEKAYDNEQSVENLTATDEGNVNLYAVWTANEYTLYFNAAGGAGSGSNSVYYDGDLPILANVPDRNGYNFSGYFDAKDGEGTCYYGADGTATEGLKYTVLGSLTLYAEWEPITYTVMLYSEGNYIDFIECTFGSITFPSAAELGLERANYDFVGWNIYDEQNWSMYSADREYNVGLTGEQGAEVTVYAAWQERPVYTLGFDANGGTGAPTMTSVHVDETITLSAQKPVRENYTFVGWAHEADSGVPAYTAQGEFTMGDKATTLYAVWKKNPMLFYDANGGEFYSNINVSYPESGETVTLTEIIPHRTGYDFIGWATEESAAEPDCDKTILMPDRDTVLYAVWEKQRFAITVSVPSGYTVEGVDGEVEYGTEISFTVTGENAIVYVDGIKLESSDGVYSYVVTCQTEIKVSDGTEFYLLYAANGGVGAPIDENGYVSGNTATVAAADEIRRTGYTFKGWALESNAVEATVSEGDSVSFTDSTVTLFAVWEPNVYYVRYYSENSLCDTVGEFRYDEIRALDGDLFEKTGHTFVGWATVDGGTAVYSDRAEICNLTTVNGETIYLYAVWKQTVTTVTFDQSGGTEGSLGMAIAYGTQPETDTVLPPVKKGYVFLGYFTAPEGGVQVFDSEMNLVNSMADYSAKQVRNATNEWQLNEENITLYAVYAGVSYTVVYVNGTAEAGRQAAVYGEPFALSSATSLGIIPPENYTFAGWSAVPDGMVAYADMQQITNGLAETEGAEFYLYAIFEENEKIHVYYDANGGMNAPVDNTAYYFNTEISLMTEVPEKEGYIFKGWGYDNKAVTFEYNGGTFTPATFSATADVRLYAVWEAGETLQAQIDGINATAEDIYAAIAALESADTDVSGQITALTDRIAAAEATVNGLDETFITDAELSAAVAALETAYSAADTALQNAIEEIRTDLAEAVANIAENTTDITSLNGELAKIKEAYAAADALIASDVAALEIADGELAEKITALETAYLAADTALQSAIEAVQTSLYNAVKDFNENLTAEVGTLIDKITALDTAYRAADTLIKSDIAALGTADGELAEKITALETAYKAADIKLQGAIDTVQGNLDTAVEELQNAITANEADIEEKVSELNAAYAAADALIKSDIAALGTADGELAEKITALETAYKAADTALQGAIDTVQGNLDTAVEELQNAITANEADIEEKVSELDAAYAAADALIKSDITALGTADGALRAEIAALETAYLAADTAIENMIDDLSDELDAKAAELQQAILSNESDIEGKVKALDEAYKLADALVDSELYSLQSADENLSASIAALDTAYKAADEVLKNAIKQLQNALDELRLEMEQNADGTEQAMTATSEKAEKTEKATKIYLAITIVLAVCAIALSAVLITKMYLGKSKKDVKTVNADNAVKADKTVKKAKKADVKHMKYRRKKN